MTFLGKIFTVLIFVMSLVFMTLAVMTFATHKNWQKMATNPTPNAALGEKKGLKELLEDQRKINEAYKVELEALKSTLNVEQAARRAALATLQTKLKLVSDELAVEAEELKKVSSQATDAETRANLSQNSLEKASKEVKDLREKLRLAQADRDDQLKTVVDLTDKVNQALSLKDNLEERVRILRDQFGQLEKVATAHGLDIYTLVDQIPPPLDGKILKVADSGRLVEISIGSDDGLKKGHVLEVYRGSTYIGRIIIRDTDSDRAVGEIDKRMQRSLIREGDDVTTKLS